LVERGLVSSRERARALILAGKVLVGEQVADKAGDEVPRDALIRLREPDHPYVSRGGVKLAHALDTLHVPIDGRTALDVGASTGGFCDVLLRRGARRVYAVDVGYGQLDLRLRDDPRLVLLERTNARHLSTDHVPEPVNLCTVDVSFISLRLILPTIVRLLAPTGDLLALVKPQFEAGRGEAPGGVVRDEARRRAIVEALADFARTIRLESRGRVDSPIRGPKGNLETFLWLSPTSGRASDDPSGA